MVLGSINRSLRPPRPGGRGSLWLATRVPRALAIDPPCAVLLAIFPSFRWRVFGGVAKYLICWWAL